MFLALILTQNVKSKLQKGTFSHFTRLVVLYVRFLPEKNAACYCFLLTNYFFLTYFLE